MQRQLLAAGLGGLLSAIAWALPAAADCTTDIDCPGPFCGDAVCQWSVGGHACVAAGTDVQGFDGWCTIDSDCKCRGQGATCVAAVSHCSFTVPGAAGGGGASSSSGSASAADASVSSGTTTAGPAGACAVGGTGRMPDAAMIALGCAAALGLGRRRRR